ncbi:hypothetical protein AADZ91_01875 [Colwelliaceae bacterium 6441]
MKKVILVLVSLICITSNAYAAEAKVVGKFIKTLTTKDNLYGGCMAEIDVSVAASGLNCPANGWVTFSCSGDFVSKEEAMRMFDSAQMSLALNKRAVLKVTDLQKHNGFCMVTRIDILK